MGERAQIEVIDEDGKVVLYSHWLGRDVVKVVKNALSRRQRWDDSAYLTRIIFSEMILFTARYDPAKVYEILKDETGYGISAGDCGGDDVVTVDIGNKKVTTRYEELSFEEFVRS